MRSVTRHLHISGSNTRVAVMTFSSLPRMRVHFRDRAGQNWNSLNWALNGIRHWGMRDLLLNCPHRSATGPCLQSVKNRVTSDIHYKQVLKNS